MNRFFVFIYGCLSALTLCAQEVNPKVESSRNVARNSITDSLLNEAVVMGVRKRGDMPMASSRMNANDIEIVNVGYDMPFVLGSLPSVLTTSDAGAGIGYTGLRIRGTDATRINVTLDGVPLGDGESGTFYWVDLPDLASGIDDVEVQRGAGLSVPGVGSFGASVNMRGRKLSLKPYARFDGAAGSFGSRKATLRLGSGSLGGKWIWDGRLSHIASDGYRDRATSTLGSYSATVQYRGDAHRFTLETLGGSETTYHAWDGISRDELSTRRKYNPCGEIVNANGQVIGFYDNQNDVFVQNHYRMRYEGKLNSDLTLSAALFYTYGKGYYEEYKNNRKFADYALQPYIGADGEQVKRSDLVRRKYNRGDFWGGMTSLNYRHGKLDLVASGGLSYFDNDHYGHVIWVKNFQGDLRVPHTYYDNVGRKTDGNVMVRATYALNRNFSLLADMQWRHVHYTIIGTNDDGGTQLNVHENFNFLNPKFGITYNINSHSQLYASVGVAHKEPVRNNYTDGYLPQAPLPKAERMIDYEMGWRYAHGPWRVGINAYYMDYKDQLVQTGRLNEIGEPVVENVDRSYRMGLEFEAAWQAAPWLKVETNATLSQNRIKDYVAYVYDENWSDVAPMRMGNVPIGFVPDFMWNGRLTLSKGKLSATWHSQYVGRQYLDNMGLKESSLDAYFISSLILRYNFKLFGLKHLAAGLMVNNIFNARYETNGYSQTVYKNVGGKTEYLCDPRFYPMAGINFMANVSIEF